MCRLRLAVNFCCAGFEFRGLGMGHFNMSQGSRVFTAATGPPYDSSEEHLGSCPCGRLPVTEPKMKE